MARYWLCPRGTTDEPLPANWFDQESWRREHTIGYGTDIPGTPGTKAGDQVVWYAVAWKVLFGIAEVTADPVRREVREWQRGRWPWYIATRTRLVVPDLRHAPTLDDAALPWSGVRRCLKLSPAQFEACSRELERVGEAYDQPE